MRADHKNDEYAWPSSEDAAKVLLEQLGLHTPDGWTDWAYLVDDVCVWMDERGFPCLSGWSTEELRMAWLANERSYNPSLRNTITAWCHKNGVFE